MKKTILSVLLASSLLLGCSTSSKEVPSNTKDISFESIQEVIQPSFDDNMVQLDQSNVVKLLNLDESNIVNAIEYIDENQAELLYIVVESKDDDTALITTEALQDYLNALCEMATLYNNEQLELIQNGYITTSGPYSILVISKDCNQTKKDLVAYLRH